MPLKLPSNLSVDYFIDAIDSHGLKGAELPPGLTVSVTSADPNTVVLTADATPRTAPDGSLSIASGKAAAAATVAQPLTPILITSHIANADGSPSGVPDATDTIEVDPGLAVAEGILFGTPA